MRYPTMSGLKIDAAGVSSNANIEEVKSEPVANMPKPILKPPSQPPTVEYGSKPPSLPQSVAFKEPVTYNDKLE